MPSGASLPSGRQDRRRGHQMADIAHEQQAAARQRELAAVGRRVVAVGLEPRGSVLRRPCRSVASRSPLHDARASWHRPRPCPRHRPRRSNPRGRRSWSARIRGSTSAMPAGSSRPIGVVAVDDELDVQAVVLRSEQALPSRAGRRAAPDPRVRRLATATSLGPCCPLRAARPRRGNALAAAITCAPRAGS